MITTYIVFFISLWIHECRSKECKINMIDKDNAKFDDVCLKKDYKPCQSLLQAFAQYPASNLTESTLVNILTILRDQQSKTTDEFKKLENFSITIIILIMVVLPFLIEMRFQIFKRSWRQRENGRRHRINGNESRAMITAAQTEQLINQSQMDNHQIKTMTKTSSGAAAPSEQKNGDLPTNNSITVSINMQGFVDPIRIQINQEDNVVKVKHKICAKTVNTKSHHFKMMVLKLNGISLDDNQYLVDKIRSVEDSLYCDVIKNLDPSDRVVVMLRGTPSLPEMIQIKKSQPIEELKTFLSQQIDVAAEKLKLFRDSNEIDKLDDLKDYESLRVIEICTGQITIKSIFDNNKEVHLPYSNVESVGNIKNKIAKVIKCPDENVILFCGNKNLDDDVFLFEIDIEQLQQMIYCCLIPWAGLKITELSHGELSRIYTYRDSSSLEEFVLKKYYLGSKKKLQENELFLKELITFQRTKSHERFVRLNGVFKEKDYFYISMEKMEGSITPYITKNPLLSEETIVEWARQILSALKYLHDHFIIHRNIKPSNILLDKDGNIKLSSFGMAKHVHWGDKNHFMEGFEQSRLGIYRYMAPEVCEKENNYGAKVDVWSFGATMIEMATGIQIFHGMEEGKIIMEIGNKKRIPFKLDETRSPEIKEFIDRCLIANPKIRATVDELLKHDFLHPK